MNPIQSIHFSSTTINRTYMHLIARNIYLLFNEKIYGLTAAISAKALIVAALLFQAN